MTTQYSTQENVRTVFWENGQVCMIDQTVLPHTFAIQRYDTYQQVADAIYTMVVRGAPAIGASAGFGMALAAQKTTATTVEALRAELKIAGEVLAKSRPTAVNLFWAIERMLKRSADAFESVEGLKAALLAEAQRIADDDVLINQRMGAFGAALVPDKATIIHHCNTGSLATVDWGTALGVVRSAFYAEKELFVLVDETRPRLQGARLTAWELQRAGIAHKVIADGASGHYMRRHGVDLCLVGADRIAANGDTANKIGTYNLAVVAKENNVPFYVVAPTSTIDLRTANGDNIEIEERAAHEVTHIGDMLIAPEGVDAGNPAFDVTPARYITAIVTERGVVYPPFEENLRALLAEADSPPPTPTPQAVFVARHKSRRTQPRSHTTQPEFEGKVVLVTGAASGIGRATAEVFGERGAAVVALDINPTVETAFAAPGVKGIVCDLTDTAAVMTAIEETVTLFGGLDILVSNAGIFPASAKIEDMDAALWDRSIQINLTSHQRVMQACIPHLKNGIDPTILVIGSKNYPAPGPGAAAYSVAKAGLTQLARVAALELASFGIRVNVVHPDAVFDTGIWTPEILAKRAQHYKLSVEEYKTKNLLGVEIGSRDVAELVCVMAGRAFSRTTGAQVPIDGGNDRVI